MPRASTAVRRLTVESRWDRERIEAATGLSQGAPRAHGVQPPRVEPRLAAAGIDTHAAGAARVPGAVGRARHEAAFPLAASGLKLSEVGQGIQESRHHSDGLRWLTDSVQRLRLGDGAANNALQECQRLNRLAQIVTRRSKKSPRHVIGSLGFPACLTESRFHLPLIGPMMNYDDSTVVHVAHYQKTPTEISCHPRAAPSDPLPCRARVRGASLRTAVQTLYLWSENAAESSDPGSSP